MKALNWQIVYLVYYTQDGYVNQDQLDCVKQQVYSLLKEIRYLYLYTYVYVRVLFHSPPPRIKNDIVKRGVLISEADLCTIGTSETVLIREVSLFQRLICAQKFTIGTSETVLIREVSLFQRLI